MKNPSLLLLLLAITIDVAAGIGRRESCSSLHIFGARETTAPPGFGTASTVIDLIKRVYPTASTEAITYPAAGGSLYGASVAAGVRAVAVQTNTYFQNCPNSVLVVVGYSQGAQVVDDAFCGGPDGFSLNTTRESVSAGVSRMVAAIIMMGNPRNVPGRVGNIGNATVGGFAARPVGYRCPAFSTIIRSYCDEADPFCAKGNSSQNSAGGAHTQRQLIEVCRNDQDIDIILLSFLISATDIDKGLNFANSDRPTEKDIIECQTKHNTFGPASTSSSENSTIRPLGSASVDGFDLDFEAPYSNIHVFTQQLQKLMDQEKTRKFYMSAAPQCPYPDMNLNPVLQGAMATALDFVFIQFYNNAPCDLRTRDGFKKSLETWDLQWAKSSGAKIFVGIPGAPTAIGAANRESYVEGAVFAADYVKEAQKYASFAGVMVWDMSQLDNNTAFLPPIVSALGGRDDKAPASNATASSNGTRVDKLRYRHAREFSRY
ncbi:hypothetical protein ONZ43_g3605 [Nemania bipapillata]|uniref:Uncharacterized protein n=1 Tax=Nemania bipapillata TaxID=110536 RepID=A0ACC2IWJ9_9PEZI|nr:hypothetical protein ONZ43_g3605 [Nemania bipapillata]